MNIFKLIGGTPVDALNTDFMVNLIGKSNEIRQDIRKLAAQPWLILGSNFQVLEGSKSDQQIHKSKDIMGTSTRKETASASQR